MRLALSVAAALVAATLPVAAQSATAAGAPSGSYVAVSPTRVLDTRTGAYGNRHGAVAAHGKVAVKVTGASGVPATASAVALTATVVAAGRAGSITASTAGRAHRPGVTSVQFRRGGGATDLVLVRPSSGEIDLWNVSAGRVQLVADVLGYYVGGTPVVDGALRMLAPARAVDSTVAAGGTLSPRLDTLAGLPDTAGAVAATVTVVSPARAGSLVAYATNTTRPAAPLLTFDAGRSVSQFGVLPLSNIQQLSLANESTHGVRVLVDVVGWFPSGSAARAHTQQVVAANAISRDASMPAHRAASIHVLGRGGVPRGGVAAVVVSVRVSGTTRAGTVVGGARATPIVVSFGAGQRVTGQAILPVRKGAVTLRNASNGSLALVVDVVGYVVAGTIAPPSTTSVARYPNDLTGTVGSDSTTMAAHGVADGDGGATFVLLDLGAQSVTGPQLSAANPGVAIALTNPVVRLRYPDLTTVLNAYLAGLGSHSTGRSVTVAIGTNNDGDWSAYGATQRGRDWADLIDGLTVPANVSVIGANDIESDFASTRLQAQTWENAYFANTTADLVFNGALNDCPTVFGDRSTCAFGWTQQQWWHLARHVENGRNRVRVLPQIYFPVQAVQWANLYATNGGGLRFVGSLTQFAADPATFTPRQGWVALYRALQWQVAAPGLSRAVDIAPAA